MSGSRPKSWWGAAWSAIGVACVSPVSIDGAPCPCPDDYVCCATTSACVADASACPTEYPPSSATPCGRDEDCPTHEVCRAWTVPEEGLAGPQECRRECSSPFPCAAAETCRPSLHDGQPLSALAVTQACLPRTAPAECQNVGCTSCTPDTIGQIFCDGMNIQGCFITLHPQCGLDCQLVPVRNCQPAGCRATGSGPECKEPVDTDLCSLFPCASCDPGVDPGTMACDNDDVVSCTMLPYAGDTCDQICQPRLVTCPPGETCQDAGGAHCGS